MMQRLLPSRRSILRQSRESCKRSFRSKSLYHQLSSPSSILRGNKSHRRLRVQSNFHMMKPHFEDKTFVNPEADPNLLHKYTKNVTELARKGMLDPVIGRGEEIRRTIQVLSRRTKNNPVLIGEPGVGKTAIIEGLAQRIIQGDVPESVKNKEVIELDLNSLVAGAKYHGEFEDRVKNLLNELEKNKGKYILFIDEMHQLMTAGNTPGVMGLAQTLKPKLARGDLRCIGATTTKEFRQHVEKDAALVRRFQPVMITEPSVHDSITILRGLREKYEIHHGVSITDEAIVAAAVYSDKYISNRFLPDKAIDLVDEAASRLRLQQESKPWHIERLEKSLITMKIEIEALRKEKDPYSQQKLRKVQDKMNKVQAEVDELNLKWSEEKKYLEQRKKVTKKLDQAKYDLEMAQRRADWVEASRLRYSVIPDLESKLKDKRELSLLSDAVRSKEIAEVVSRSTGIPVENLLQGEKQKLMDIESILKKSVVGQDEAIEKIANTLRISRAGLHSHDRPIGVFLFLGPTGVGKTELAKSVAELLFEDRNAMIRIDMSEYYDKYTISRLIGSAPGYVGYEEGGELTNAVRSKPYSVILLDEFEKAHPDVFNVLLQVFDDGRLTDGKGVTVDFRNTLIIMTSNMGADLYQEEQNGATKQQIEESVNDAVKGHLKPEFINRIDHVIHFNSLMLEAMPAILDIQIQRLQKQLDEKKIVLEMDEDAKKILAEKGFDPFYGARPLKRILQSDVLNEVAKMIIMNKVKENDGVKGVVKDGQIVFEVIPNRRKELLGLEQNEDDDDELYGMKISEREEK